PSVSSDWLQHRQLRTDEFWRRIPAYKNIDTETFLDHAWQSRNSATSPARLFEAVGDLVTPAFREEVAAGCRRAPLALRLSPYLLSLMNWEDPYACPLRKQFIPVGNQICEDHPRLTMDSLHEQPDSPVPGVTHRYRDKASFFPLNTCPVYCRYCTRSYSVG